jgi:hypothetical protein
MDGRFFPYFEAQPFLCHFEKFFFLSNSYNIGNNDFYSASLQKCTSAIDRSHVPVSRSPRRQALWRNRKGSLSQNVILACDFDMNVTFISCGWEESANDAHVLS